MRFLRCARLCLTTGLLILCSAVFTARAQQTQFDGSWSGTTGQGRLISFTVTNGSVGPVSFLGTITGCSGIIGVVSFSTRAISNNAFTITVTTTVPGGVSFTLSGTFTSTSAVNGTLSFTLNGCSGSTSTTWTASRAVAPPPSPIPTATNLTFIPHSAFGGGFITRRYITNLSTTATNAVTINRIGTNGTLVESTSVTLQPLATLLSADSESQRTSSLTTEWYAIGSERSIAAAVLFDCCASGTDVISAVGVLPQAPGTSFTAPFHYQQQTSTQPILVEGMAVANRTELSNTITVTIRDQNGTVASTDTLTPLGAYGQTAFTVSDLPNARAYLQGRDSFVGTLVISGTGQFSPLYVGNLGGRLFSLPLLPSTTGSAAEAPGSATVQE